MNKTTIFVLTLSGFIGCDNKKDDNHINKDRYVISMNEQVEIYYSTNSCCYYCISNKNELKHIELVDQKTIDSGPSDCAGCNVTEAFVFKGTSIGNDTVELKHVQATMGCDSNDAQPERYIVEVK